jgi:hypothetical protein
MTEVDSIKQKCGDLEGKLSSHFVTLSKKEDEIVNLSRKIAENVSMHALFHCAFCYRGWLFQNTRKQPLKLKRLKPQTR